MARFDDLPLFPLGIVLLPGEVVPLHIFEPRYREMIARCTASDEPFCLTLADGEGTRDVGCLAGEIRVVERYADGRLDILVTGTQRVQILEIDESSHAYLSVAADPLEDDAPSADPDTEAAAIEAYRELVERVTGDTPTPQDEPAGGALSYAIASRIEFDSEIKQGLLEARSEETRLRDVTRLVRTAARAVTVRRAVAERAHTNGKVSAPAEILDDEADG
jgi:Lon protease-like protein